MSITYQKGNLFDNIKQDKTNLFMAHQMNCQNVMRSDFAKDVSSHYPQITKTYHEHCQSSEYVGANNQKLPGLTQSMKLTDDIIHAIQLHQRQIYRSSIYLYGKTNCELNRNLSVAV